MKNIKLILLIIFGAIVILLVVQNTALIETRFLWIKLEVPAIVVLFVTAVGGFVSGILVALFVKNANKTTTTKEGETHE